MGKSKEQDIRWQQRMDNFKKAVDLIEEVPRLQLSELSLLEKEGIVQRFEFTLELAWKVLKDKMEYDGVILDKISPKTVIKQAYSYKYIDQIDLWIEMINDRNLLSHRYDQEILEEVIPAIQNKYADLLMHLYTDLKNDT